MKTRIHIALMGAAVIFSSLHFYAYCLASSGIANCDDTGACVVKTYKPAVPVIMEQHAINLTSISEGTGDAVTVLYNGTSQTVLCDGTWKGLPAESGQTTLQNRIRCELANDRASIRADLVVFSQETFSELFDSQPGVNGYPTLAGTSEDSPYCSQETSPNAATACVWEEPIDGQWGVYARTEVADLAMITTTNVPPVEMPSDVCADDMDNDGSIDTGEIGYCEETEDGDLCLLDAVKCLSTTSDVICPAGSILNPDTDKCEAPPMVNCAIDDYRYIDDADMCVIDPVCLDGGIYNPHTDRCEIAIVNNSCPNGYTYVPDKDYCVGTVSCDSDGVLDVNEDRCEMASVPNCPDGFSLNFNKGVCEMVPSCPDGSVYDESLNQCFNDGVVACPDGYVRNQATLVCEATPFCLYGGTFNPSTNRCETTFDYRCPLNRQSYSDQAVCNDNCRTVGTCLERQAGTIRCASYLAGYAAVVPGMPAQHVYYTAPAWAPVIGWAGSSGAVRDWFPTCTTGGGTHVGGLVIAYPYAQAAARVYEQDNYNYRCMLNGKTYTTLTACNDSCAMSQVCYPNCPWGYSAVGNLCVSNPTCQWGGSFNSTAQMCEAGTVESCPDGFSYDIGAGGCVKSVDCPYSSVLNGVSNLCEVAMDPGCASGYNYDISANICSAPIDCSPGYYDLVENTCKVSASSLCPDSYIFDEDLDSCTDDGLCFDGSVLSQSLDMCAMEAVHDCAAGTEYSSQSKLCEAYPICEAGSYKEDLDACYEGDNTCPYGPNIECKTRPGSGEKYCSPLVCYQLEGNVIENESIQGANDKKDDGPVNDQTGACEGTIYIFNGADRRCRTDGITILFGSCCAGDDGWFDLGGCEEREKVLAQLRGKGLCHYIGNYCSKELSLGLTEICIEHSDTYCCFNSKLSRIIQEQARPQFTTDLNNWGVPEGPNCRGFTPEEFQMIDFTRVDLSEWIGDIEVSSQQAVQESVESGIETYYNGLDK